MALVSGLQIATAVGLAASTAAIDAAAGYADSAVKQFLGFDPTQSQPITEYHSTRGSQDFPLRCPVPVTSWPTLLTGCPSAEAEAPAEPSFMR